MGGDQSNVNNSQIRQSSLVPKDGYTKVKLTASNIINSGRPQNYAEQTGESRRLQPTVPKSLVDFKIDDPEGVTKQAQIYNFDYENYLNHYLQPATAPAPAHKA